MNHDAKEYDSQRIEFEELWQKLRKTHPQRLTDFWIRSQEDGLLREFCKMWTLSYNLFGNKTDGRRSERAWAEIERRRRRYEESVRAVLPGWGADQKRLNALMGRE